jgi:hypothetical protein
LSESKSHSLLSDLEPLELCRLKSDSVLYYKCSHTFVDLPSGEYFIMSDSTSLTREGGNRLLRPLCSTRFYENDFYERCVPCWNFLPFDVVSAIGPSGVQNAVCLTLICPFLLFVPILESSSKDQRKR